MIGPATEKSAHHVEARMETESSIPAPVMIRRASCPAVGKFFQLGKIFLAFNPRRSSRAARLPLDGRACWVIKVRRALHPDCSQATRTRQDPAGAGPAARRA